MYSDNHIIIKYVGFKPINYAINLDAVSSSIVFNEFNSIFLLNVLLI